MSFKRKCCCFDSSQYTGEPDSTPTEHALDVLGAINELDLLNSSGREAEGEHYLEVRLDEARRVGDWRAELSFLSELLGQYRRSMEKDKGLDAIDSALEIIRDHHLGSTVSGATIILNAGTTMKCFGLSAESIPLFTHTARVFSSSLDPNDYRFAGLYNNMALSYRDISDFISAERYFTLAAKTLEKCEHPENDLAVTMCNMAELYDMQNHEDPRIADCLERAWDYLNSGSLPRDGYHAFTISKCAPTFEYLGFFLYAKKLRSRAEEIYAAQRQVTQ